MKHKITDNVVSFFEEIEEVVLDPESFGLDDNAEEVIHGKILLPLIDFKKGTITSSDEDAAYAILFFANEADCLSLERSMPNDSRVFYRKVSKSLSNLMPKMRENPFVSDAQRRACYAKKDPKWDCKEFDKNPRGAGSLHEFVEHIRAENAKRLEKIENEMRDKGIYISAGRSASITRSTRPGVKYQVTMWNGDEPVGHYDCQTLEEASKLIRPFDRS